MQSTIINRVRHFLDSNALLIAMVVGAIGYPWFHQLMPFQPVLIFLMLFFTFCKVNPLELRFRAWHWVVLGVQLLLSAGSYYGLLALGCSQIVAQGIMVCFIMPTATAAPIIAGKLGGSIPNLTTFTLMSNFATALIVPAFFPIVNPAAGMTFWQASLLILSHIAPLLLGPFFTAWILRLSFNTYYRHHGQKKTFHLNKTFTSMPFYLWALSIIILIAAVTNTLVTSNIDYPTLLTLCLGSLAACLIQFFLGKYLGYLCPAPTQNDGYREETLDPNAPTDDASVTKMTAGQALGQKNTSLGVWMAQVYLNPLSSLGPAAYIIWQNTFNSLQLFLAGHKRPKKQ